MKPSKFFIAKTICLLVLFSVASVAAKDEWTKARTKNFQLVGNAPAAEIRDVAFRLEQFREVFQKLFPQIKFDSPIPVNVVVFKDKQAFRNFQPINESGQIRDWVDGYFVYADDANYIALSADGEKTRAFRTIFHEYVHFLVNNELGRVKIPPWFNEGLAEYYATLQVENDRKITLGATNAERLALLQKNKLIGFETFFNTDNYSLQLQGSDGAGIFYAQAWALMHFLMQENKGARVEQLNDFIDLVLDGKQPKDAFAAAFQTDYATIETALGEYVRRKNLRSSEIVLKDKLSANYEIEIAPLAEIEAKIVLGDLLAHTNRLNEAAALLSEVLKSAPDSSAANAALGMVLMRQEQTEEAKKYLEQAVALGDKNYLAYFYYAYALSREGMTEFGFVTDYPSAQALKMREALKKAIALNPNFAESYNLFAFVNIIRNENLDEALDYINRALKLVPGNQWYQLRVAEIYLHQEEFSKARQIAQAIFETAPDDELRLYSKTTLKNIDTYEAALADSRQPSATVVTDKPLTDEELAEINRRAIREAINYNLRRPKANEKRVLGYLTKIECGAQTVDYTVKTENGILKLSSENFDSLKLMTFDAEMSRGQIDCEKLKKDLFAVITYRPSANRNPKSAGEMIAIEFVPKDFEFLQK